MEVQLHRPKDINSLNEEFFGNIYSEKTAEEKNFTKDNIEDILGKDFKSENTDTDYLSAIEQAMDEAYHKPAVQAEIDKIIVESESDIKSGYVAKQIEKLSNTEFRNDDRIFHDFPEYDMPEESGETSTYPDEKSLFDAFPEVEFDPSVFTEEDDEVSEKEARRESIKKAKEEAKATIDNEKQKIREQKDLERTVQKPFAQKKVAICIMTVLIIIGILSAAVSCMFYAMGSNDDKTDISSVSLYYINGTNISSSENEGSIIAVTSGKIQGRHKVLFYSESNVQTIGEVLAIGDGVYGIDLGPRVYKAEENDIVGIIKFQTPDVSALYALVQSMGAVVFGAIGIYFTLIIAIFALIIRKLNNQIRIFEENYELV